MGSQERLPLSTRAAVCSAEGRQLRRRGGNFVGAPQARGEPFSAGLLMPQRDRGMKQFNDLEMVSGMDPLGFGPAPPPVSSGHSNAQMNGNGTAHPVRPKRTKGGFL